VDGNKVFVGKTAVAVASTEEGPVEENCMGPISKYGPREWAKKSLDMPMSAALAAAGDELEGRKLSGV
jgi:hypothetical protein